MSEGAEHKGKELIANLLNDANNYILTEKSCKERMLIEAIVKKACLQINNDEFLRKVVYAQNFINSKKFKVQEISCILRNICKMLSIPPGRSFEKHKVTRIISFALYYDSWYPFLEHATAINSTDKHSITLDVKKGTQFISLYGSKCVLDDDIKCEFIIHKGKNRTNELFPTYPKFHVIQPKIEIAYSKEQEHKHEEEQEHEQDHEEENEEEEELLFDTWYKI